MRSTHQSGLAPLSGKVRTLLASSLRILPRLAGEDPTGMPFNTPFVSVVAQVDYQCSMVPPHSTVAWSPRASYEAAALCLWRPRLHWWIPSATSPAQTSTAFLWALHPSPLRQGVSEAVHASVTCSGGAAHSGLSGAPGVSNPWTALILGESSASLVRYAATL